jgi:hypothetical protein
MATGYGWTGSEMIRLTVERSHCMRQFQSWNEDYHLVETNVLKLEVLQELK